MNRFIKQSVDLLPFGGGSFLFKAIELAGRVCYKSEDKITDESAEKFVSNLLSRGHTSVLEHGTVSVKYNRFRDNVLEHLPWVVVDHDNDILTTNYREYCKSLDDRPIIATPDSHKRYTFRFVTSRAIANEIVRHRVMSFSQESTRYVNYGKRSAQLVIPTDLTGGTKGLLSLLLWAIMCNISYVAYKALLLLGWKPQAARGVLPLDLKTEIVVTGFKHQWEEFLLLRKSSSAHPDIRELARQVERLLEDATENDNGEAVLYS